MTAKSITDKNDPILLTLVIPCYNESDRIDLMFAGISSFVQSWNETLEIIIVNDGSKDNTEALLRNHPIYLQNQNLITITSQQNTGKGGALRNGVLKGRGQLILTLDADMATSPLEVINWQRLLGQFDDKTIYIGSREHNRSVIRNETRKRKLAGNVFNLIVRSLTRLKLQDTQCGFKLYPGTVAKELFQDLKTYGWAHDVELLYKAHLNKIEIVEMPIEWTAIEGSKIRLFSDAVKMFSEVLTIVRQTKQNTK